MPSQSKRSTFHHPIITYNVHFLSDSPMVYNGNPVSSTRAKRDDNVSVLYLMGHRFLTILSGVVYFKNNLMRLSITSKGSSNKNSRFVTYLLMMCGFIWRKTMIWISVWRWWKHGMSHIGTNEKRKWKILSISRPALHSFDILSRKHSFATVWKIPFLQFSTYTQ